MLRGGGSGAGWVSELVGGSRGGEKMDRAEREEGV